MALELSPPVPATEVPPLRSTSAKDKGPNPFLEPHPHTDPAQNFPEGWLAKSYDDGVWYDVGPVQGHWEDGEIRKGGRKGQPTRRMVGDAAEITRWLRDAATELGIGVSIKYFPVKNKNGTEAKDRVLVKYLGTNRKQRKSKDGEEEE